MKQVIQKRLTISGGNWISVNVDRDADASNLIIVPGPGSLINTLVRDTAR